MFEKIVKHLIDAKQTVTVMESCTGGMIASLITDNEGSSACFKGGFVTYSNEAKVMCGVPGEIIEQYGVYSKETASAMACAARERFSADFGIGVTGTFANADPANSDSIPGIVHFAISDSRNTKTFTLQLPPLSDRNKSKLFVAEKIEETMMEFMVI